MWVSHGQITTDMINGESLNSIPALLFPYLPHIESRGLSKQYTNKISEYIGKYLINFKEVSSESAYLFRLGLPL